MEIAEGFVTGRWLGAITGLAWSIIGSDISVYRNGCNDGIGQDGYSENSPSWPPPSYTPPTLPPPNYEFQDIIDALSVYSNDPNSEIGPAGFGPSGFISPTSLLPYRINFENAPTASAPAQQVTITDQLDPNLDWNTFQLTALGFGDTVITIPSGSQYFQTTVPMTYNGSTFDVEIEAGIQPDTGLVYADFYSIDPSTDLPPDVLTGFLPPEDGTGRGQGYLSYTVQPKAGLATGAQIHNVALISFDGQQPIATDQVSDTDPSQGVDPSRMDLNTIDAGPPTSSVTVLPAYSPASFTVSWSGSDDPGGSGIASYGIYVSDNGGAFSPWITGTTATSATFTGQAGHTYGFYSVATDNVGNVQATPTAPQATTFVQIPTTTSLTDAGPNPSTVGQAVSFVVTVSPTVADGETVILEDASNGDASVGTGTLTGGTVTISVANLSAGTHNIFAIYGGDATFVGSQSDQVGQVVNNSGPAPALTSTTVNGADVTIAGQSVSLAGKQRSMVDNLVFQFNEAVTLDPGAFTIALHSGVSVNGRAAGTVGTLPTLSWSTPDGGLTWVVTFSGAGVVGGSIADGDYDITVVSTAVHANGQTMTSDVTNTFYRLFGDTNGAGQVSGRPDLVALQSAWAHRSGKRITWPTWTTTGTGSSPVGRISRISRSAWVSFTQICQRRSDVSCGAPSWRPLPALRAGGYADTLLTFRFLMTFYEHAMLGMTLALAGGAEAMGLGIGGDHWHRRRTAGLGRRLAPLRQFRLRGSAPHLGSQPPRHRPGRSGLRCHRLPLLPLLARPAGCANPAEATGGEEATRGRARSLRGLRPRGVDHHRCAGRAQPPAGGFDIRLALETLVALLGPRMVVAGARLGRPRPHHPLPRRNVRSVPLAGAVATSGGPDAAGPGYLPRSPMGLRLIPHHFPGWGTVRQAMGASSSWTSR